MKNFIMILCFMVGSGCSETTSTRSNSQSTTENSPSSEDGLAPSETETPSPESAEPEPAFLSLTPVTDIKRWKHTLQTKNLDDLKGADIKVENSACGDWIKGHFINRCHRARHLFLAKKKDSIEAILKDMSEQMMDSLFRGASQRIKLDTTYSHHKKSLIEMFHLGFQEAFENKTQPLSKETASGGVEGSGLVLDPKHQSFVQTCTQAGLDHKYTSQWCEVLKKTFPEEEADPYQNEHSFNSWWGI